MVSIFKEGKLLHHQDTQHFTLREDKVFIVVPKNFAISEKDEIPLEALKEYPILFFPRKVDPVWYDVFIQRCAKYGFTPNITHFVNPQHARLNMANEGLGITIINESSRDDNLTNLKYCLPISEEQITQPINIAWRRNDTNESVKKIVELLQQEFNKTSS